MCTYNKHLLHAELAELPPVSVPCSCADYYPQRFKVKNKTYAHRHNCRCFKKLRIRTTKKRKNKMFVPRESFDLGKTPSYEDKCRFVFNTTFFVCFVFYFTSRYFFVVSFSDYQLCPQCPHFNNYSECELFRDSCK